MQPALAADQVLQDPAVEAVTVVITALLVEVEGRVSTASQAVPVVTVQAGGYRYGYGNACRADRE